MEIQWKSPRSTKAFTQQFWHISFDKDSNLWKLWDHQHLLLVMPKSVNRPTEWPIRQVVQQYDEGLFVGLWGVDNSVFHVEAWDTPIISPTSVYMRHVKSQVAFTVADIESKIMFAEVPDDTWWASVINLALDIVNNKK